MSRIGKKGIKIPAGAEVKIQGNDFFTKGKKGETRRTFPSSVAVRMADGHIHVDPLDKSIATNALWGAITRHIENMLIGVSDGYVKKMILEGVGYRAEVKGNNLNLALGFSHPVVVPIPQGISVVVEKGGMTINAHDKEEIGRFAAYIRELKKPEPYKGKGFRYEKEVIKRKQGKKTV